LTLHEPGSCECEVGGDEGEGGVDFSNAAELPTAQSNAANPNELKNEAFCAICCQFTKPTVGGKVKL